jgi:hypothetical protein
VNPVANKFLEYQEQLLEQIARFPNIVGLMFAGSSANTSRADEFSDQDFYLIVADGTGEHFRTDLTWLPRNEEILLRPRETEHGLKVFYEDGTLLEFAVFENSDLPSHLAPMDNRVAYDKAEITSVIKQIAKKSAPKPFSYRDEYQLFLTLLFIGVGRVRRGEIIAGSQHIKSYAVAHLLGLIRHFEPVQEDNSDSLNRFRRFEKDYPELGREIATLLDGGSLRCAAGLLEIADRLPVAQDYSKARDKVIELIPASHT